MGKKRSKAEIEKSRREFLLQPSEGIVKGDVEAVRSDFLGPIPGTQQTGPDPITVEKRQSPFDLSGTFEEVEEAPQPTTATTPQAEGGAPPAAIDPIEGLRDALGISDPGETRAEIGELEIPEKPTEEEVTELEVGADGERRSIIDPFKVLPGSEIYPSENIPLSPEVLEANKKKVAERAEQGRQLVLLAKRMKIEAEKGELGKKEWEETWTGLSFEEWQEKKKHKGRGMGIRFGEEAKEAGTYRQAGEILNDIIVGSESAGGLGIQDFVSGMWNVKDEMIPFIGVLPTVLESINMQKILKKPQEEWSDAERQLVEATTLLNEWERAGIKGNAFEYGEIFGMMVPYAAEFGLTGGSFKAGQQVITKGVEKAIGVGLATKGITGATTKLVANVTGSVFQSTVNAQRWASEALARMTPQAQAVISSDKDMAKAFGITDTGLYSPEKKLTVTDIVPGKNIGKAFLTAYALNFSEFLTERWGQALGVGAKRFATSKLGKALLNEKHYEKLLLARLMEKKGLAKVSDAKNLAAKLGWHGVIVEVWGEEYPNMIINAAIEGDDAAVEKALNPLNEDLIKMIVPAMVFSVGMQAPAIAKKVDKTIREGLEKYDEFKTKARKPAETGEPAEAPITEAKPEPDQRLLKKWLLKKLIVQRNRESLKQIKSQQISMVS